MSRKKAILICVPVFVIIAVTIIIALTRVKNFQGVYNEGTPDCEYLVVFDLRLLDLTQDKEQKEYLEKLTAGMIKEAFTTGGESKKYSDVISSSHMKALDPKPSDTEYECELGKVDVYCLANDDKAIVFLAHDNEVSGSRLVINICSDKRKIYDRVYFEKEGDTWVVRSIDSPA